MLVMTAKVDKKKILIALGALILAIATLAGLIGADPPQEQPTSATAAPATAASNDERVRFLQGFGWEVSGSPSQSMQVRIPVESSEVFDRYNQLQKSQGYDLTRYAGKTVMRYVYPVSNYPNAADPVYATVLVYKDQIIGGDITDSGPSGRVQGFAKAPAVGD